MHQSSIGVSFAKGAVAHFSLPWGSCRRVRVVAKLHAEVRPSVLARLHDALKKTFVGWVTFDEFTRSCVARLHASERMDGQYW